MVTPLTASLFFTKCLFNSEETKRLSEKDQRVAKVVRWAFWIATLGMIPLFYRLFIYHRIPPTNATKVDQVQKQVLVQEDSVSEVVKSDDEGEDENDVEDINEDINQEHEALIPPAVSLSFPAPIPVLIDEHTARIKGRARGQKKRPPSERIVDIQKFVELAEKGQVPKGKVLTVELNPSDKGQVELLKKVQRESFHLKLKSDVALQEYREDFFSQELIEAIKEKISMSEAEFSHLLDSWNKISKSSPLKEKGIVEIVVSWLNRHMEKGKPVSGLVASLTAGSLAKNLEEKDLSAFISKNGKRAGDLLFYLLLKISPETFEKVVEDQSMANLAASSLVKNLTPKTFEKAGENQLMVGFATDFLVKNLDKEDLIPFILKENQVTGDLLLHLLLKISPEIFEGVFENKNKKKVFLEFFSKISQETFWMTSHSAPLELYQKMGDVFKKKFQKDLTDFLLKKRFGTILIKNQLTMGLLSIAILFYSQGEMTKDDLARVDKLKAKVRSDVSWKGRIEDAAKKYLPLDKKIF